MSRMSKIIGCQIALDDFGAGFTSFRNLKSLDFDIIKVDGQFVNDLKSHHENQMFIRSLVQSRPAVQCQNGC